MNRLATFEGWQVFDLATRLGGQMRPHGRGFVGYDMPAALQLADALGVERAAVAEFLPLIEAEAVIGMNGRIGEQNDGGETG